MKINTRTTSVSSLNTFFQSCVLAVVLAVSPATAFAKGYKINLRDASFVTFVSEVADITGKNFVVDPRITGNVTVISNKSLTPDEVYELFLGVLNVNGVVAIPSGNTVKLVPDSNAKQIGVPFNAQAKTKKDKKNQPRISPDQVITRIIHVEHVNPNDLIPAIRPLLSASAHMATMPDSRELIVSDRAQNLDQLQALITKLDQDDTTQLEYVALKETEPSDIMDLIKQSLGQSSGTTTGGSASNSASKPVGSITVTPDVRNNRLLIQGDKNNRQRVKSLIQKLDVKSDDTVQVFYLKNTSAKDMVSMLQNFLGGKTSTVGANTNGLSASTNFGQSGSSTSSSNSNTASLSTPTASTSSSSASSSSGNSSTSGSGNDEFIVSANESLNAVMVSANNIRMKKVKSLIQKLDLERQQVLIQAAIIEVTGDKDKQLGVQWALGNNNVGYSTVNFPNTGASLSNIVKYAAGVKAGVITGDLPSGALFGLGASSKNSDGSTNFYGAIFNALSTDSKANLLSAPYVTTVDNREATLLVGQNVPFLTGSVTTSGGTASPYNTIERKDVGINLKVKPRIGQDGKVVLEVDLEVSQVAPKISAIASTDLITNKRKVVTMISAENNQIVSIGGLMQDESSLLSSSVPYLSDIPFVGNLFKARSKSGVKRNLLVFLQPTILKQSEDLDAQTAKRYDQLKALHLEVTKEGELQVLPPTINSLLNPDPSPKK